MKFNINNTVRVKLTDLGRAHNEKTHPRSFQYLEEDAEGWSSWQLWYLMQTFGPIMYLGGENPFEIEIDIPENKQGASHE